MKDNIYSMSSPIQINHKKKMVQKCHDTIRLVCLSGHNAESCKIIQQFWQSFLDNSAK